MLGVCKDTFFCRKKRDGLPPRFYLLFHFLFLIINYKVSYCLCNKCNTPRDCVRVIQPFGRVKFRQLENGVNPDNTNTAHADYGDEHRH